MLETVFLEVQAILAAHDARNEGDFVAGNHLDNILAEFDTVGRECLRAACEEIINRINIINRSNHV